MDGSMIPATLKTMIQDMQQLFPSPSPKSGAGEERTRDFSQVKFMSDTSSSVLGNNSMDGENGHEIVYMKSDADRKLVLSTTRDTEIFPPLPEDDENSSILLFEKPQTYSPRGQKRRHLFLALVICIILIAIVLGSVLGTRRNGNGAARTAASTTNTQIVQQNDSNQTISNDRSESVDANETVISNITTATTENGANSTILTIILNDTIIDANMSEQSFNFTEQNQTHPTSILINSDLSNSSSMENTTTNASNLAILPDSEISPPTNLTVSSAPQATNNDVTSLTTANDTLAPTIAPATLQPITPQPTTSQPITSQPITPQPITPQPTVLVQGPSTTVSDEILALLESRSAPVAQAENTPQYNTALYIAFVEGPTFQGDQDKLIQRFAIISVYLALKFEWPQDVHEDECGWDFIECNQKGKIVSIKMSDLGLTGAIPSEIGLLESLIYISMSDNEITGVLPEELFQLVDLEHLSLENNRLGGSVPQPFTYSESLQRLYLGNNQFSGNLPPYLPAEIRWLSLRSNQFQGPIPESMLAHAQLRYLDLSFNQLVGQLPSNPWLPKIRHFYLDHNSLTGPVANSFAKSLTALDIFLNDNQFSGEVPGDWHEGLLSLQLQNNNFFKLKNKICKRYVFPLGNFLSLGADCNICFCREALCGSCVP